MRVMTRLRACVDQGRRPLPEPSEPSRRPRWRRLDTLAALCALCTAGPTVLAIGPDGDLGFWLGAVVVLTVLLSLPFALLALFARALRIRALRVVAGGVMLLMLVLWWWAVHDAFMVPEHSDPLNGLIFVFLPIYATGAAVAIGMVLWIAEVVLRRRG